MTLLRILANSYFFYGVEGAPITQAPPESEKGKGLESDSLTC